MFGAKYSRLKFWLLSIPTLLVGAFFASIGKSMGGGAEAIVALIIHIPLIHILANRIRGFGSNPWLSLLAFLPLVGLFQAFYYGFKKSANISQDEV